MNEVVRNPLFGLLLCIFSYQIGLWVKGKLNTILAYPLLIASIIIALLLTISGISYEDFSQGGDIITMLLTPATAALGLTIYRQRALLRKNLFPVLMGCLAGAITSVVSVTVLCWVFGIDQILTASLLPKSVTTAIALDLSEASGGLRDVTMAAVIITGIGGGIINHCLIKLFGIKNSVAIGVGMGTACHGTGTAKALELGEVQGAMSGVAMGITGIFTAFIFLFL